MTSLKESKLSRPHRNLISMRKNNYRKFINKQI